ncbi:hypothetical protein NBRC116188_14170 [Oceaniserpentilla sp. 4NH20-0058]|uniref:GGDEF domain-containing protein n=1 Tax=Oceaniserpentilla sp. 4NH20-0058 TaxID=3127660 RepID=UPI00310A60D0
MKLQLAIINIVIPCLILAILGYLPEQSILIPNYVATAIIVVTLGRAVLLYQQQAVFSVLPLLFITQPASVGFEIDIYAPFALPCFMLYLWLVNLQWGQRPWLHSLHVFNFILLILFVACSRREIVVPDAWLGYAYFPMTWLSVFFALTPLLFVKFWLRIGRWASYWPLLVLVGVAFKWADESYILLWGACAALFSLSLDGYVMAYVDELTGIAGRRALEFKLKMQAKHYFVAMVDVDHFKKFNDTYGHQVGDDVLKVIAKLISKTPKAKAYRYGGEEFCLVFANLPQDEVKAALEQTRTRIADYALYPKNLERKKSQRGKNGKAKPLHITASFGLAQHHSGHKHEAVLERADKALYKAKQAGRNCVIVAK